MGFGACPKFKKKKRELENRRFSGSLSFFVYSQGGTTLLCLPETKPRPSRADGFRVRLWARHSLAC
ncbi:hypothetical protein FDP56_17510 [Enterococcus casseliflavus]|nr:hypothetical protein [Enterococcus casseliflavus]